MRFKGPIISLSILAALFIYYAWKHPSPVQDFMNPQIRRLYDRTESLDIRENDATAVRMTMGEAAVDVLLPILLDRSESAELRCAVAYELRELKDSRIKEAFEKMKHESKNLERCGEGVEISESIDAAKEHYALVAERLKEDKPPESLLNDKYPEVRQVACERLGATRQVTAIKPLLVALNDKNKNVRHAAARALIKIRHPEVVRQFISILKDEKSPATDLAYLGLLELTGAGIPKDYSEWEKWLHENDQTLDFYLDVNSKNAFPE